MKKDLLWLLLFINIIINYYWLGGGDDENPLYNKKKLGPFET